MKNKYIKLKIFIIVVVISASTYPQDLQLIGAPGGIVRFNKLGVQLNYPQNVYSAGYYGSLFRSNDGGTCVQPIETYYQNRSISTISPHPELEPELYLGIQNYSLRTTNSGKNWEIIETGNYSRNHFAFNLFNTEVIYMNRNTKELWRSDDGGDTWYFLYSFNNEITSLALSSADTSVLYCGADNYLFKSTNSGWSWIQLPIMGDIWKIRINPFNPSSVFIKKGGLLIKSMNDGMVLQDLLSGDVGDFEISYTDTNIIYAAQYGLVKTTNSGNTWFSIVNQGLPEVSIGSDALLLNPKNDKELYAGINALGVYKTTNGGDSWLRTNLAYSDVYTIYADTDTAGHIITGQYGWGIMYSFNYGKEWVHPSMGSNFQNLQLQDFSFNPFNGNEGMAAAYYGIYKTTDRGKSWYELNSMEPVITVSYHPGIPNTVFNSLENGVLLKSTDGGTSWYQVLTGKTVHKYAYHPTNKDVIYVASSRDILKSTDAGETWQTINSGITNSLTPFTALAITDSNPEILYSGRRAIGQEKGALYMTSNGGNDWFRIDSTIRSIDNWSSISSIWIDPAVSRRFYIGLNYHGTPASNGGLYLTEDNGIHLRMIYNSHVNVITADNSNPRNVYIGTKFGVMKFKDTLTVTDINHTESTMFYDYTLLQSFPNPFNSGTTISWHSPVAGHQEIKLFDVLGREIEKIVDEYYEAGSHSTLYWAKSTLPSGVYFYQLKAGDFVETKKMIYLK